MSIKELKANAPLWLALPRTVRRHLEGYDYIVFAKPHAMPDNRGKDAEPAR